MAVKKTLAKKKKRLHKSASKTARKAVQPKRSPDKNSIAERRKSLQNSISKIPPERLSEVEDKINEILATGPRNEPKSLRGIWAGKGFENIDIEKALKEARDAMLQGTLNKDY
ncbi:MAG TPA: hypothetical protein VGD31_04615 [Sphingobacteriaceae bacterium]